ncbi:MAG TPA: hypothetical protein ENJ11_02810 [Gammaproteobacteria bacterium]|nr:hypothetical protein [Gammaproteobacteria bacterium]
MKTIHFPYLASGMGLFLLLLVVVGSKPGADGSTTLPLLTLLIINEFAFFVTAIGGFIGLRQMINSPFNLSTTIVAALCLILTAVFIWQGIQLWPL